MPDPIPANPRMAKVTRFLRLMYSRFIWMLVLAPILGVSAYSLFWVARHFGVPPYIAIFNEYVFRRSRDGWSRLFMKYAQAGLSGGTPRTFVRVLALVSAFLQTFHAKLDNQPPGAWVIVGRASHHCRGPLRHSRSFREAEGPSPMSAPFIRLRSRNGDLPHGYSSRSGRIASFATSSRPGGKRSRPQPRP